MSCTNCSGKGACDDRKGTMFGAIEETLARLYPTRRWNERDEAAAFGAGLTAGEGEALAETLATQLRAAALYRTGGPEETCDWIYVLCVGRTPSLVELREGALDPETAAALRAGIAESPVEEVYLRVALSTLARFAAVQEVVVAARVETGGAQGGGGAQGIEGQGEIVLTETPRTGVFTPMLLKRLQGLVAALVERGIRHLDFGEILEAPDGFEPGDYAAVWGGVPSVANYFFYPQPASAIVTATLT